MVSFAAVENTMYKRRRLSRPTLPSTPEEADQSVRNSRYAMLEADVFYRGTAGVGADGIALVFATTSQLQLLQSASEIYFDATFKVVPRLFYQLLTIFVPYLNCTFPMLYVLMNRKSQALYQEVFETVKSLVPEFKPTHVMADFEEASVSAFRTVYGNASASGCWFHYTQAIIKRVQKLGLKEAYHSKDDVKEVVRCALGLPPLPASDIVTDLQEIRANISSDMHMACPLQQLVAYVQRQWLDRQTVGPQRLSVHDHSSRTNNILESYHAPLRRRIQVVALFNPFLGKRNVLIW